MSIEELLRNAGVNDTHCNNALRVSSKGNSIVLIRNPNECKINNYNPNVILTWQANMELQYVMNA